MKNIRTFWLKKWPYQELCFVKYGRKTNKCINLNSRFSCDVFVICLLVSKNSDLGVIRESAVEERKSIPLFSAEKSGGCFL